MKRFRQHLDGRSVACRLAGVSAMASVFGIAHGNARRLNWAQCRTSALAPLGADGSLWVILSFESEVFGAAFYKKLRRRLPCSLYSVQSSQGASTRPIT